MKKMFKTLSSKQAKQALGVVFIVFLFALVLIDKTSSSSKYLLESSKTFNKTTGWTLISDNQSKRITLPYKETIQPSNVYQIQTILNDVPTKTNYMLLRSSMQDFEVFVDDQLIHTHYKKDNNIFEDIDVSMWVLVELPDNVQDSVLTVNIISDVAAFSGVVNEVKFGEKAGLIVDILKESWLSIVSSFLLIVGGLIIVMLSIFTRIKQDNRLMSLGLIFITSGLWILTEGRVLQFFVGNRLLLGATSYTMIMLIPIIIYQYLYDAVFTIEKNRRNIRILSFGYVILLLLMFAFEVNLNVPYIIFMRWALIYIIFSAGVASVALIKEVTIKQNQRAMNHIKYIAILLVAVVIEIIVFYAELYTFTSFFILVGFLVFLALLMADTFVYFKEAYLLEKENELLAQMVYIDQLTGGKNRSAYERDLQHILDQKETKFRLVLADLNGLKEINDNFGHHAGDVALQSMFNALEAAFSEVGVCYRLSGDEMAVLMDDVHFELFKTCVDKLSVLLADYTFEFSIKVAVGSGVYDPKTFRTFEEFYQQVDQKMYIDKKKLKLETAN